MDKKTLLGLVSLAFVAVAGVLGGFALDQPEKVTETVYIKEIEFVNQTVPVEVIKEVNHTVEVEVPVEKEGFDDLAKVLADHPGVDMTDELDSDEVTAGELADRAVFLIDSFNLAISEVKAEGEAELDKEKVGKVRIDEDDIERFNIRDDFDEIEFDDIDFDDKDVDVLVKVSVEHDDDDYDAVFRVEIRDGEVDDLVIESLERD